MLYSKTAQYSIQAILYIATNQEEGQNILVKDIAQDLELPASFLSKILQTLSKQGFLKSTKGPTGGFAMSDKGREATLDDIVHVIDGEFDYEQCILGFKPCEDDTACPMHNEWKRIREEIKTLVKKKTIEQLAYEMSPEARALLTPDIIKK